MKLPSSLHKIHEFITNKMSNSWFVENVLIAKVEEEGIEYDCIYCTIIRTALLFTIVGVTIGVIGSYGY